VKRIGLIVTLAGILALGGISPAGAQTADEKIKVSLHFDKTPIAAVLKMLATQNKFNLVVTSAVTGEVSIDLDNVDLKTALNAILLPNNFNYYIDENVIIIKAAEQQVSGEMVPLTYHLKYLSASKAEGAVKAVLSEKGHTSILAAAASGGDNNQQPQAAEGSELVVYDFPAVHDLVADLLSQIDIKKRQVSVEVKIIETGLSGDEQLGINWPQSISASLKGVPDPGQSGSTGTSGSSATNAAVMPLKGGEWQLGYLTAGQVTAVLNFLKHRSNSKLLSNPRLTTIENEPATIAVQTTYPIQTINRLSEGAVIQDVVTFQDKDIGLSLKVTPRINDDSSVTLHVSTVVEEIIDLVGPTNNQRPETSQRSATTTVVVGNNQTIALGGLLKENRIETEDKVFFLGSIPILGKLFSNKRTQTQTTDLMILITPKIID